MSISVFKRYKRLPNSPSFRKEGEVDIQLQVV